MCQPHVPPGPPKGEEDIIHCILVYEFFVPQAITTRLINIFPYFQVTRYNHYVVVVNAVNLSEITCMLVITICKISTPHWRLLAKKCHPKPIPVLHFPYRRIDFLANIPLGFFHSKPIATNFRFYGPSKI